MQESVIAVAKKMHDFKYDPAVASFKTWLYQIVSRRIADQFRKRHRAGAVLEPLPDDGTEGPPLERLVDPASLQPDPEWEREWEENLVAAAADRVRRQVNPRHFQVFEYHVLQGHSAAETAQHLQTTSAAVYWIKHRVGRALRKEAARLREKLL